MRWAEISLSAPAALVDAASAVLTGIGCAGTATHDPQARSSDPFAEWAELPASSEGALCTIRGYLPVDDRLEAALSSLDDRLHILAAAGTNLPQEVTLRTVEESDWAEAWKSYFHTIRVGERLVIKPTWDDWTPGPGDVVIEIDPGMAFGSGGHATTRLCLRLVEEAVRPGDRVLDWGTGSGILALGAAHLGAASVLAIDLDPVAVRVTRDNVALNDLADRVTVEEGSVEGQPPSTTYDLIIANIVAAPLIAGASDVALRLKPGGTAIFSGIIAEREAEVVQAAHEAGLEVEARLDEEEWRALRFRRPA